MSEEEKFIVHDFVLTVITGDRIWLSRIDKGHEGEGMEIKAEWLNKIFHKFWSETF